MGALTVDEMREQVQARLRELTPAKVEHDRLSAVRDALQQIPSSIPVHHQHPRARRRGQGASSSRAGGSRRAKRGANRAAIVKALTAVGTMTMAELARATGIGRPVLATTLSQMKAIGLLDNEDGRWGMTPAGAREVAAR